MITSVLLSSLPAGAVPAPVRVCLSSRMNLASRARPVFDLRSSAPHPCVVFFILLSVHFSSVHVAAPSLYSRGFNRPRWQLSAPFPLCDSFVGRSDAVCSGRCVAFSTESSSHAHDFKCNFFSCNRPHLPLYTWTCWRVCSDLLPGGRSSPVLLRSSHMWASWRRWGSVCAHLNCTCACCSFNPQETRCVSRRTLE